MNITDKAMLVSLSVKQWTARKYDRKITEEVNHTHQAKDAGRFNKLLIEKKRLSAIQSAANAIRIFHYNNTLPWADEGFRLLPVTNFFDYTSKMNELKEAFEKEANNFVSDYQLIINEAQSHLNLLFNPLDYPNNIEDKFAIKFNFMPFPDANDFRIKISDEHLDFMKKQITQEVSTLMENATVSIIDKIKESLVYMRDRLTQPDSVFRDSLFTNMNDLISLSNKLNVTSDSRVSNLTTSMRDIIHEPQDVRNSDWLRTDIVRRINDMLTM